MVQISTESERDGERGRHAERGRERDREREKETHRERERERERYCFLISKYQPDTAKRCFAYRKV